MRKIVLWILLAGMFIASSCLKGKSDNSNTCSYDPCNTKAPDSQVVKLAKYLSDSNITAQKHCSGLYYTIISEGTGSAPTPCSAVAVNYTGTYTSGQQFDKSTAPAVFSLLSVIQGWTNGVPLIKKGGKIKLYVPPALGYGNNDYNGIPGNSILVFDIELLDFQ